MAGAAVGRDQILAFRAARQGLDGRQPASALLEVIGVVGVQDTPPGNADTSLAARLDIDAPVAAEAIASKRVVLTWSLRGSPHLLAPDDLPVFTLGARPADGTITSLWRQPEHALVEVERAMFAALTTPRTKGELSTAVSAAVSKDLNGFCRACDAHHPSESVFRGAPLLGRIVLTSTAPVTLVRAKAWLGHDVTGDIDAMRTELLLRYLRAYAPTTSGHFAEWVGITKTDAKARWAAVADALVPVGKAFVLEEDLDELQHPAPVDGVRLLPNKDAFLQARDRDLLFPEPAVRKKVFPMLGGPGVVLHEAIPVGTWRGAAKGTRYDVTVEPLGRLTKAAGALIDEEATRVARARGHEQASLTIA